MKIVTFKSRPDEAREEIVELSLKTLDDLRAKIKAGEITAWVYVGYNDEYLYNGGVNFMEDYTKTVTILEQTKVAILNDVMYGGEDE